MILISKFILKAQIIITNKECKGIQIQNKPYNDTIINPYTGQQSDNTVTIYAKIMSDS